MLVVLNAIAGLYAIMGFATAGAHCKMFVLNPYLFFFPYLFSRPTMKRGTEYYVSQSNVHDTVQFSSQVERHKIIQFDRK